MAKRKRNRWGSEQNKTLRTYKGIEYRSLLEVSIAKQLTEAGTAFEYESTSFNYFIKKPKAFCFNCGENTAIWEEHWYTPDFILVETGTIIEVKGRFLSKDRTKMLAVREEHPDREWKMLFGRNGKVSNKTSYSQWCEQKNFDYAIGSVPRGWYRHE